MSTLTEEQEAELLVELMKGTYIKVRQIDTDANVNTGDVFREYMDYFKDIDEVNNFYDNWVDFTTTERILDLYIDAVEAKYPSVKVYIDIEDETTNLFFADITDV